MPKELIPNCAFCVASDTASLGFITRCGSTFIPTNRCKSLQNLPQMSETTRFVLTGLFTKNYVKLLDTY